MNEETRIFSVMYSLRIQLIFSVILSFAGGAVAYYLLEPSPFIAALVSIVVISLAVIILHFFVYRPLQKIQTVVSAQKDKSSLHRVIVHSSEEFEALADTLNGMLDSFRTDIARMKKLEQVRSEFLGNVSHELRTPIFTTQGLIETLLNGAIDDKKVNKGFLKKALNNTERLNTLLSELIDISRIQSGEMKLRFRFFDVVVFLHGVVNEMQLLADQLSITLSLEGDDHWPIEVYGDKERLRQVMVNLIENAIKYSEANGRVRVTFNNLNDRVDISVEDSGIGIAPQHLSRIFERFYRVDKDRSREVGGTGLGLAIVKHIVEAHRSTIAVESEIGVGTKFTFSILKTSPD